MKIIIPKAGDIFKFPLVENKFGFGRVLLNIQQQCIDANKLEEGNPLEIYNDVVLIEIYEETSTEAKPYHLSVLIPGILTSNSFLRNGMWPVIDFLKVDPEKVDFPEGIAIGNLNEGVLVKGELRIPFECSFDEIQSIGISPGTKASVAIAKIVLNKLGGGEELGAGNDIFNIARHDLRFSVHRKWVFERLGLDPNESYFKLAKKYDHDLARFYQ